MYNLKKLKAIFRINRLGGGGTWEEKKGRGTWGGEKNYIKENLRQK